MQAIRVLLALAVSISYAQGGCPGDVALPGEEACTSKVQIDLGENERVLLDSWSHKSLDWDSSTGQVISIQCP